MDSTSSISATLESMQDRLNLSDVRMAAMLGVHRTTFINWKTGKRKPPAVLDRLVQVLGTIEALAPAIHAQLIPAPIKVADETPRPKKNKGREPSLRVGPFDGDQPVPSGYQN